MYVHLLFYSYQQKDDDKTNFTKLINAIKGSKSGKVLGEVSKDKFGGEFCEAWRRAVSDESFTKVGEVLATDLASTYDAFSKPDTNS